MIDLAPKSDLHDSAMRAEAARDELTRIAAGVPNDAIPNIESMREHIASLRTQRDAADREIARYVQDHERQRPS
jgi:hypothetical protein